MFSSTWHYHTLLNLPSPWAAKPFLLYSCSILSWTEACIVLSCSGWATEQERTMYERSCCLHGYTVVILYCYSTVAGLNRQLSTERWALYLTSLVCRIIPNKWPCSILLNKWTCSIILNKLREARQGKNLLIFEHCQNRLVFLDTYEALVFPANIFSSSS